MNLNEIKPKKVGTSDKYSSNLYKYLKENPKAKVFYSKTNYSTEEEQVYDKNNLSTMSTYIGQSLDGGISGVRLQEILGRLPKMGYFYLMSEDEYVDVTEEFFEDYKKIGRCLFDSNHSRWLLGDENRFAYSDEDTRECNWCNLKQKKHTKEIRKTIEEWK